jgi:hypothetical protein
VLIVSVEGFTEVASMAATTDLSRPRSISGDRRGSSPCGHGRLGKVVVGCPLASYGGGLWSCGDLESEMAMVGAIEAAGWPALKAARA